MRRIPVVEDDHAIGQVIGELLVDEGYAVRCAVDGVDTLDSVATLPPDVIISDIEMPRLDGLTLRQRLHERGDAIPLLLMSATMRCPPLGGAFLAKPFTVEALLDAVAHLLAEGPTPDEPSPKHRFAREKRQGGRKPTRY